MARPIALAPTKYIARSARKLRGEALSRASRSTGATPFSDVDAPRKPPRNPATAAAPGTVRRGGGAFTERAIRAAAIIVTTPSGDLDVARVDAPEDLDAEPQPGDRAADEQRDAPRPGGTAEADGDGQLRDEREREVDGHDEPQRVAVEEQQ